jgi:hypothetical protein
MNGTTDSSLPSAEPRTKQRALELLAEYLCVCPEILGPGTDGLILEEVIGTAYPAAMVAGRVPGTEELVSRHVDLADALRALFINLERPEDLRGSRAGEGPGEASNPRLTAGRYARTRLFDLVALVNQSTSTLPAAEQGGVVMTGINSRPIREQQREQQSLVTGKEA